MRIPSGITDQYIYFVAVDATDLKTREPGLASFTVYRSRNGGAAASFTTPTINETDTTNMPGVYELLLDEDMTIDAGDDSQEMAFHITHAGMAPVTRTIELYRLPASASLASDIHSSLVIVKSDLVIITSDTTAVHSDTTAIHTQTTTIASDLVIVASDLLQVYSDTTIIYSDTTRIHSDTTVIEAGGGSLTATQASQLARIQSDVIIVGSDLLQVYSDTTIIASDAVQIYSDTTLIAARIVHSGTAQGGAAGSITLAAGASATDDFYNGATAVIISGTGAGQAGRVIDDYVGATKIASVSPNWTTAPDATSVYDVVQTAPVSTTSPPVVSLEATQESQLARVQSDLIIVGSDLLQVYSDSTAIHSDTTAVHSDTAVLEVSVSDVESSLVIVKSDLVVITSDTTQIGSDLVIVASDLLQVYSDTTHVHSDTTAVHSDTSAVHSQTTVILTQRSVPAKGVAFTFDFKMVDATDKATPEAGITVTATVSKEGAAFAATTGTVTEIGSGMYQFAASAADMNANRCLFRFTGAGCAATEVEVFTDGGV